MEEIQVPKKERKFLKAVGNIAKALANELVMGIGRKFIGKAIDKVGNKRQGLIIVFVIFASTFAIAQYPTTPNKQRLGYQTTGNGLVFRGRANDTTTIKPSTINNAYFILDTVNNVLFNYIKTKGGWVFNNTDTVINNITIDTTSLSNRINLKLNISDTASMLTNYLRTGVAAGTYLPLTGGTMTGTINRAESNYNENSNTFYFNILNYFARKDNNKQGQTAQITFTDRPGTNSFPNAVRTSDIYLMTAHNWNGVAYSQYLDTTLSIVANDDGGRIGISKLNPAYKLDVNGTINANQNISTSSGFSGRYLSIRENSANRGGIYPYNLVSGGGTDYSISLFSESEISLSPGGSFVKKIIIANNGSTTFESPLTVNSSAVFNEGSTDSDFRVESDANVNMVFVDASTDRVGIGTNAPTKTLEVNGTLNATGDITEGGLNVLTSADTASLSTRINGKVSLTGDEYINGQKTFGGLIIPSNGMQLTATGNNSNKLIGINTSSYVGEVTLGTGLSLTSNVLNATERYYFDLGTVAGQADNATGTYSFAYSGNALIVPTSLNGYCIDTVNIRAISCTDCPPAAGEKDYYMGVYKVSAGNPVLSTGMTMQGSQITCNEYDLKQENVNHVLTTGDVWWVYLNGSYFSDMEIIKASFIVKKTCN